MTQAAKGCWLAWHDSETGEGFGESTVVNLAYSLAARIASEPLIDGRPHAVDLYQEPGHQLLHRFLLDGSEERLADPSPPSPPSPAQSADSRSLSPFEIQRRKTLRQRELEKRFSEEELQSLNRRRAEAEIPLIGYYEISYAVAWDPESERVAFFDYDHEQARTRLRELGETQLILVDSRDWQPLDATNQAS